MKKHKDAGTLAAGCLISLVLWSVAIYALLTVAMIAHKIIQWAWS